MVGEVYVFVKLDDFNFFGVELGCVEVFNCVGKIEIVIEVML